MISSDADILPDMQARVNATWTKLHQVTGVLCDCRILDHLKAKIYMTIICPVTL